MIWLGAIPVNLDLSELMSINKEMKDIMAQQLQVYASKTEDLINKMQESINTQRRIIENTY